MQFFIRQCVATSRATLLSLPRRLAISFSMVGSIMLVVCVLCGFLAMAQGFERTLKSAGSSQIAIILGGGTNSEANSELSADIVRKIMALSGDIGAQRDKAGNPLLSREIITPVQYRADGAMIAGDMLALRGMDPSGPSLRDGISLSAGRLFTPGSREIMVGDQLAATYPGFAVGNKVQLGPVTWSIVGHISAHGSVFESEIWGDLDAVRAAFDRPGAIQSLRVRLAAQQDQALSKLQAALSDLAPSPLTIVTEAALYADQAAGTARLIRLFGWPVALLMAIGASAGALNTMMSSLADRTIEIATFRALGFNRISAFLATWLEAVLLAILGVALGLGASWLVFNGWQASTLGANHARMAFQLVVSDEVIVKAGAVGLLIGAIGGALPAISAARLPITKALRARG
ncbi:ABC transporter permease [Cohaesibacter sp. CAU 1516]|uniref:ABC transporter permease n=1 Tax=Cohaesibacter sp. CAU 1516 TaxID=2576038 RepID=UPI0010FF2098|nr:ABC transporter permease [Cohaesibacter sp. CAU 1516]TLP49200.1 ABC transporter permease [Cohaesibacter sp. CAU 1516]